MTGFQKACMRVPHEAGTLVRRRPGLADRVLGGLGAAVIGVTLFGVRLWARVTRTPYYGD
jgi:hypothetical protein